MRAPNRYTAVVNPRYTEGERRQIGFAIIEFIQDRTAKGKGVGGTKFRNSSGKTKYQDSYTETREFKIAGKRQGRINLELSGDMLDSIEIIDISITGRIVIGFRDSSENDKSVYMREKGYDFLGLTNAELQGIISRVGPPSQQPNPSDIAPGLLQSLVRGILGS